MDSSATTPAAVEQTAVARYTLAVLVAVYTLNYIDRQVLNILAEPIRRDLALSDTQLGLVGGLAFALFYTLTGVPIARIIDRPHTDRARLIAVALVVWSGMTAVTGMAQSFVQLFLARIGVGVGEAACVPASHSLIADTVPADRRATALAIFGMGVPIGGLLGLAVGGGIADALGWRWAFVLVGLPGVVLGPLLWFTLREPRRGLSRATKEGIERSAGTDIRPDEPKPGFTTLLSEILRSPSMVMLLIAAALISALGYGKSLWTAAFFIRAYDLSPGTVGLWWGAVSGSAGIVGTLAGGWFADRYGRRHIRRFLLAPAIGLLLVPPFTALAYASRDWQVAMALLWLPQCSSLLFYGPTFAAAQMLVRPQGRALIASVLVFVSSLIGGTLGPLLFGMISDLLKPVAGNDSLRWVLGSAGFVALIPAALFWMASRRLERDIVTTS